MTSTPQIDVFALSDRMTLAFLTNDLDIARAALQDVTADGLSHILLLLEFMTSQLARARVRDAAGDKAVVIAALREHLLELASRRAADG